MLRVVLILRILGVFLVPEVHYRLVDASPVVSVFTLPPLPLEGLLTLIDGCRVVEIPLSIALLLGGGCRWCALCVRVGVASGSASL